MTSSLTISPSSSAHLHQAFRVVFANGSFALYNSNQIYHKAAHSSDFFWRCGSRYTHTHMGCVPLTTLLFNLTGLLVVYIIPMSYRISHDSDISNQVRNKNKGAYPSNSIRFSVALRRFFSKCFCPPTPKCFPFTHSVSIPSFLYTQLHA